MDELALEWNMQIQKSIHINPPLPPFTRESAVLLRVIHMALETVK
jgi:hypothetical protein